MERRGDSALGADFHVRGARMDEQIEVLRRLWTEESVTFRAGSTASTPPACALCQCSVRFL